jgi:hypothetical protein
LIVFINASSVSNWGIVRFSSSIIIEFALVLVVVFFFPPKREEYKERNRGGGKVVVKVVVVLAVDVVNMCVCVCLCVYVCVDVKIFWAEERYFTKKMTKFNCVFVSSNKPSFSSFFFSFLESLIFFYDDGRW